MMKYFQLFILLLVVQISGANSATINCNNTTLSEVQAKVNQAASGDTVVVPAGSSTWGGTLNISGKALTLQGNGIGSTNITNGFSDSAVRIDCSITNFVRLTGFTFISSGTHTSKGIIDVFGPQANLAFRVDNNRIVISSAVTRGIVVNSVYGLIDHNAFDVTATGGSIQQVSVWGSSDGSDGGFTPWTRPLTLGTTNAVYVENNTFTYTTSIAGVEDTVDANGGARIVIRNNTFINTTVGFHGTDSGDRRSCHSFEIYNNTFTNDSSKKLRAGTIRGGTGVFYGNTYGGSGAAWNGITLMYYRACPPLDQSGWGTCDGTLWKLGSTDPKSQAARTCSTNGTVGFNTVDKETLGTFGGAYQRYFDGPASNGYPGRDQPGITTGQVVDPIYVWNNGLTAGAYDGGYPPPGGIEAWVKNGRDYINNGSTPKPGYVALAFPHPLATGGGPSPTPSPTASPTPNPVVAKYVDKNHSSAANNPSNGSQSAPFLTIAYGISQIRPGETLYVKNGTYNEAFTIKGPSGSAGATTRILAYAGHAPIINGKGINSGRMKIAACSYIDFEGFTITNHNQGLYVDNDAGTDSPAHHINVRNVTVHDVGQEGIAVRGNTSFILIENCTVFNTGLLDGQNGEGMYIGASTSGADTTNNVTMRNNTVHNVKDEGIELKSGSNNCIIEDNEIYEALDPGTSYSSTGGAIEIDDKQGYTSNPNHVIRNNVIHDIAYTSGITKRGIRAGTGCSIYNNVLYNIDKAYSAILSNETNDFTRLIYNNTVDATTANAVVNSGTTIDSKNNIGPASSGSNLAVNPSYFVNYATHDYHLAAGSAPINAGVSTAPTVTKDIAGVTRPQGSAYDIGAYEFVGGATPTPTPTPVPTPPPTPPPSPTPTPTPSPTPTPPPGTLTISDIQGLQEALDGKSDKGHVHDIPASETSEAKGHTHRTPAEQTGQ